MDDRYPTDAASMNYACLITGGLSVLVTGLWFWKSKRGYQSPTVLVMRSMSVAAAEE